jgi:hypothetical protein
MQSDDFTRVVVVVLVDRDLTAAKFELVAAADACAAGPDRRFNLHGTSVSIPSQVSL